MAAKSSSGSTAQQEAPPMEPSPAEVTRLLGEYRRGDRGALERLLPLVYRELRRIAAGALRAERSGHTLQPTALVHEAYLRLADQKDVRWQNRAHFLGCAAQVMRHVLVDAARARRAGKRGGDAARVTLTDALGVAAEARGLDVVALDDALRALAALDARQARVVELRYFGGLSIGEAAEVLGVSPATVSADWAVARTWLRRELRGAEGA
jgi:RNA polymerase sigma factor (TIGR02999 family)